VYIRDGTLVVNKCTFDSSTTYYYGAALVIHGGYSVVKNCRFLSNFAGRGGAVYQHGGYLNLVESEFVGNVARFYGGGIYAKAGVLRMESSAFSKNRAMDDGKGNSVYNTDAKLDWICPDDQYLYDHPGTTIVNNDLEVVKYCTPAIIRIDSYIDNVEGSCATIFAEVEEGSEVKTCNLRAAVQLAMDLGGGEIQIPTMQDHFMTEGLIILEGSAAVAITPFYDDATSDAKQTLPSSYARDFNLLYDNDARFLRNPHDYARIVGTNNTEKLFYISGSDADLYLERMVFDGFSSTRHGGVVYVRRGTMSAHDCLFINNYSSRGGAIYLYQGIMKVSNSMFMSNHATYGGSIYHRDGLFQSILSSFVNNKADGGEGNTIYLNSGQLLWDCGDNHELYALPTEESYDRDIFTEDYCVETYEVAGTSGSAVVGETFVVVFVSSQTPDSLDGTCTTDDVEYRINVPTPSTMEQKDFLTTSIRVEDTFDVTRSTSTYGLSTCNLRAAVEFVSLFGSGTVVLMSDDTYWITEGEISVNTGVQLAITSQSSTQMSILDGTNNKNERLLYINHEMAEVLLDDLIITHFHADAGSVLYVYDGKITISDSVLSENEASSNGGVAYIRGGSFVADDTLFQNNFALFSGGSVYLEGGVFSADTCWFDSNSADLYGGAVYVRGGTFETLGSGFLTNLARVEGTSVYNHAGSVGWLCSPDSEERQQVLWNPNDDNVQKLEGDLSATEYCADESGETSWKVNSHPVTLSSTELNLEVQLKVLAAQQSNNAVLEGKYARSDADAMRSESAIVVEVTDYSDSLTGSCNIMASCNDARCANSLLELAQRERMYVKDVSKQEWSSIAGISFNDFHALDSTEEDAGFGSSSCNFRAAMRIVQMVGKGIVLLPTENTHHLLEGEVLINSALEVYVLPTFEMGAPVEMAMAHIDGSRNRDRFLQLNHELANVNIFAVWVKNFKSDFSGAAVFIRKGSLHLQASVMSDNEAAYSGGSAYIWEGSLTAVTCIFISNSAAYGGAVFVRDGMFNAFKECAFYGNVATSGEGHSLFTKKKTLVVVTCLDGRFILNSVLPGTFSTMVKEEPVSQKSASAVMIVNGPMNQDLSPADYCDGQYFSDKDDSQAPDDRGPNDDRGSDKGPPRYTDKLLDQEETNQALFAVVALAAVFSLVCTVIGMFIMLKTRREKQAIEEYRQQIQSGIKSPDNKQPAVFSDVQEYERREKEGHSEEKNLLATVVGGPMDF